MPHHAHEPQCLPAGFLLVLTSLLDAVSGYAAVRVLTAPFIWLGTNSLAVFAGDILLQARAQHSDQPWQR